MDRESIVDGLRAVTEDHGPWNAYDFKLSEGVYTKDGTATGRLEPRLAHILQLISDLAARPVDQLRVLDLACLEGVFALELASHGAEVVGVEARRSHVARAAFAAQALGLDNVSFLHDDVRNLNRDALGTFDVVLCLGILYHLDTPDLFRIAEQIASVCRGFAVFDTHVSLRARQRRAYEGQDYWGRSQREHDPDSTMEERERASRSSIDNTTSFWLTKRSLVRLLANAGFTTTLELAAPLEVTRARDRSIVVALKGTAVRVDLVPGGAPIPRPGSWPERDPRRVHRSQSWRERARIRVARLLPDSVLRSVRRLRGTKR